MTASSAGHFKLGDTVTTKCVTRVTPDIPTGGGGLSTGYGQSNYLIVGQNPLQPNLECGCGRSGVMDAWNVWKT